MYIIATWIAAIVGTLGVGGAIAALIFAPAVAAPILEKVTAALLKCKVCLVVGVLIVTNLVSFWYGRDGQCGKGHAAAIAEIASEDAAALASAVEKRAVWKECRARSGEWDQSTGECK